MSSKVKNDQGVSAGCEEVQRKLHMNLWNACCISEVLAKNNQSAGKKR